MMKFRVIIDDMKVTLIADSIQNAAHRLGLIATNSLKILDEEFRKKFPGGSVSIKRGYISPDDYIVM
jgi:hypothetical protein